MDETSMISVADAYRAMVEFLNAYWQRGSRSDEPDPIASLLGDIQFGEVGPTATADPAQWADFLRAAEKVTRTCP
ncbi:MAG: hypothetical protein IBJ05_06275 [Blastomonas sp.]|nr:hypothetical protein [Blastomonas sp.]